jgi:hypothetical protein
VGAFARFATEEVLRRKLKNKEKPTEKQILGFLYPEFATLAQEHHDNKLKSMTP